MRNVTYSMATSLDGYIVGPEGKHDWSTGIVPCALRDESGRGIRAADQKLERAATLFGPVRSVWSGVGGPCQH